MINENCIEVSNLNKRFGNNHAVKEFSLTVKKGEIYGFLGPNGSGKTTSIRMMCGLLTPDSGSGHCLQMDIFTQRATIKRHIGYMTQHFSMWGNLSIRENLMFIARIYNLDQAKKRVDQTLAALGLESRQHQLAKFLSGGWKQRMTLAACMLRQPSVLFLDEPTAGVDPRARREFWQILHQLSDRGIAILVSTHYMDEAERCHRVAYLSYGRLLANGSIQSIIQAQNLITYKISGKRVTALESKLSEISGIEQTVIFGNSLFVTARDENVLKAIFIRAVSPEYEVCKVQTTLEDAFTWLMKKHEV